jgi:hypothetical protein
MTDESREDLKHELSHIKNMEHERSVSDEKYAFKWTEKALIGFIVLVMTALCTAWIATVIK